MKTLNYRPFLLAVAIASFCSAALAQAPPPTDNPTDAPASSQSAPPPDPAQPTETMSPATPPADSAGPGAPAPATDPMTDAAMQPDTPVATTPAVDETVARDRDERHGGFPWGLLGLLGLLGLIPRRAKVDTYTAVRDARTRTDGLDTPRT